MDNLSLVNTIAIFPVKLTVVNFQYFWSKWETKKNLIIHIKWFGLVVFSWKMTAKCWILTKITRAKAFACQSSQDCQFLKEHFYLGNAQVLTSVNMLFFLIDDFLEDNSPRAVVYFLSYSEVYSKPMQRSIEAGFCLPKKLENNFGSDPIYCIENLFLVKLGTGPIIFPKIIKNEEVR